MIKKRLMPVGIAGPLPEAGTPIMAGDKTVGELRSGQGDKALALIRLETLEDGTPELHAGNAVLTPHKPDWAEI